MDRFDPATLAFYSAEAEDYAAYGPNGIAGQLDRFLDLLPEGARILELGCGAGRDAAHMAARGFDVDPTDGVPEMVALATRRSGLRARVMRFDELEAQGHYDAVVACYSLLHVPRGGLVEVLQRVWQALKPGGRHMATFKTGANEGRDRLGRYYNYLSEPEIRADYAAAGTWCEVEAEASEGRGYEGDVAAFLAITMRKPA